MKVDGVNAELVTEFAKDLNYGGQMSLMMDQQEFIFAEQNYRQHRLRDHVDYAITDSPLMLSTVYTTDTYPARKTFCKFVHETYELYENINIFLIRPEEYQQVGRYHSHEEAKVVDGQIEDMLREYKIPYNEVQTGDDALDNIMELVAQFD